MATELQRQFCRSRIFRGLMDMALLQEGLPMKYEYRRVYYRIYADVFDDLPEPFIKRVLYVYISCYDVPAEDKAEAVRLLRLSQTALTREQKLFLLQAL